MRLGVSRLGANIGRGNIEAGIKNSVASMTNDPRGTNIRAGAGKNFPVLKTLKDDLGLLFHIAFGVG
jgi:hypothetical protein